MAKKKKCKNKWNVQKFIEEENEKTISMLNDLSPATDEEVNDAQYNFAKILDLDLNGLGTGYSEEMFGDTTMMAYYDRSNDTIFINPNYLVYKDLIYYSIAHELRHKWQNEHNKEEWFSTYKSRDKLDLEQYNKQIAEIDANAFAVAAMDSLYKGWNTRIKMQCRVDVKKQVFQTDGVQELYNSMLNQYFANI